MNKSVLVLAAHPDDEVLGCGGTIAKLSGEGAIVHVAFLADGVYSRANKVTENDEELAFRRTAAEKACAILGVSSVSFDDLPDNRLDTVALLDIVKKVELLMDIHKPELVITHHAGDVNIDHQKVHQAAVVACRPQPSHFVKTLLCFEVASSTEWQLAGASCPFTPNWFVDITSTYEKKMEALLAYKSELREWPHPRSTEAVNHLVRWRGASIGVEAAEAFMLGRLIA